MFNNNNQNEPSFDSEEISGFNNITALFEWLLLVLVLFYLVLNRNIMESRPEILVPIIVFALFVLLFHYSGFIQRTNEWIFSIEIWAMTIFVTAIIWYTQQFESALVNLYLLPVITSALMLRQITTLLLVGLVAAFYILVGYWQFQTDFFTVHHLMQLAESISPIFLVAYVTSVLASDIKHTKSRLKILSETDQLTGLLNMRAFNTFLRVEISRAQRYRHNFALIMVDADNLKEINDHHGHEAGNAIIRYIAYCLQSNIRSSDIVARFGGDEFVLLLLETSAEGAKVVAERICEQISKMHVNILGADITTSVSIGIAMFPDDAKDKERLFAKADQAMYFSKSNGKGRVTLSSQVKE